MIMQELKILKRNRIELFRMRCRENGISAFQTACPGAFPCRVQFVPLTDSQQTKCKNITNLSQCLEKKEFLKSFAYFLQVLYKCYTFVI